MKYCCIIFLYILADKPATGQNMKWFRPRSVQGVCEADPANPFHRLPENLKAIVRKQVWDLSLNTAGEFLHFNTTAEKITVRYTLNSCNFAMPHMPATGVSGLDLYALDAQQKWHWAPGSYHFGDTCQYVFQHLELPEKAGRFGDFYLYLPLYNSVTWLEIGVEQKDSFAFNSNAKIRPIVAYGTSILQGAVASRPGLAWTNIVGRDLHLPIINLGFSGNGQFEKPVFDLMSKVDAQLFILDCMPNLTSSYGFSDEEIKNRVFYGVRKLRATHPRVPIIFAEHAVGYSPFYMDTQRLQEYHNSSLLIKKIVDELARTGIRNIYLLSEKQIGLDINSTTEGLHPNDIGMMKYATAYERKIREVLAMEAIK